jgi:hypothetical protein
LRSTARTRSQFASSNVEERGGVVDRRVVHQDVEPSPALEGCPEGRIDVRRRRDVGLEEPRRSARVRDLTRHRLKGLERPAEDQNVRPLRGGPKRDRPADPPATAGHDGMRVLESAEGGPRVDHGRPPPLPWSLCDPRRYDRTPSRQEMTCRTRMGTPSSEAARSWSLEDPVGSGWPRLGGSSPRARA